ncbi:hypothetical protein ACQ4M3_35105 [Leptolyngbya sp. AN03gr2]|uniref:hypothetical protein n=1 Tax=unclassified Leptolyngbya TaxID=2650499 RepID=UPI003D3157E4
MNIDPKSTIAQYPSLQIRQLFRAHRYQGFSIESVADNLAISPKAAETLIADLVALDFLEKSKDQDWIMTDQGTRLERATAAKRIKRKTAEELLQKFLWRCWQNNQNSDPQTCTAHIVRRVVVFGSYCTDAQTLGDLDLAIDILPRFSDPGAQKQLEHQICQRDQASGLFAAFLHPYTQFLRFLTQSNRYLSVATVQQYDVVLQKPGVPRRLVFDMAQGGNLTIVLPDLLSIDDHKHYRCGYADAATGSPMSAQNPIYQLGYRDYQSVPTPLVRQLKTARSLRGVLLMPREQAAAVAQVAELNHVEQQWNFQAFSVVVGRFVSLQSLEQFATHLQTLVPSMYSCILEVVSAEAIHAQVHVGLFSRTMPTSLALVPQLISNPGIAEVRSSDYPFDQCLDEIFQQCQVPLSFSTLKAANETILALVRQFKAQAYWVETLSFSSFLDADWKQFQIEVCEQLLELTPVRYYSVNSFQPPPNDMRLTLQVLKGVPKPMRIKDSYRYRAVVIGNLPESDAWTNVCTVQQFGFAAAEVRVVEFLSTQDLTTLSKCSLLQNHVIAIEEAGPLRYWMGLRDVQIPLSETGGELDDHQVHCYFTDEAVIHRVLHWCSSVWETSSQSDDRVRWCVPVLVSSQSPGLHTYPYLIYEYDKVEFYQGSEADRINSEEDHIDDTLMQYMISTMQARLAEYIRRLDQLPDKADDH